MWHGLTRAPPAHLVSFLLVSDYDVHVLRCFAV